MKKRSSLIPLVILPVLAVSLLIWQSDSTLDTGLGFEEALSSSSAPELVPDAGMGSGADPAEIEVADFPAASKEATAMESKAEEEKNILEAFSGWTDRYLAASTGSERAALEQEGIALAKERRPVMKTLIQENPRVAIASATQVDLRESLPQSVRDQMERPVSGRGEFDVWGVVPDLEKEAPDQAVLRRFRTEAENFEAFVYGEWEGVRRQEEVFAHGIALDNLMAFNESPIRVLSQTEAAGYGMTVEDCPVDESLSDVSHVKDGPVIVGETARATMAFCCDEHVSAFEALGNEEFQTLGDGGGFRSLGNRSVLVIRVDFAFDTEDVVSEAAAFQTMLEVDQFFRDSSYRQFAFSTINVTEEVIRLGEDNDDYEEEILEDPGLLHEDARAAAQDLGYPAGYDFVIVAFPGIGYEWAGLGQLGGPNSWVQGGFTGRVVAHELGHNFGLFHAGHWKRSGPFSLANYPVGLARRVEYGNDFDAMGASNNFPNNHFSANFKHIIDWLPTENVVVIETEDEPNDMFRIYRQDGGTLLNPNRKYSIRVDNRDDDGEFPEPPVKDLWIDFRQLFPGSERAMNGVVVQWGDSGSSAGSHLLSMNFGSSSNAALEAPLRVGETFPVPEHELLITPTEVGGTSPNEYVDVAITSGTLMVDLVDPVPDFFVGNPSGTVELPRNGFLELQAEASATGSPLESVQFLVGDDLVLDGVESDPGHFRNSLALAPFDGSTIRVVAVVVNEAGNSIQSQEVMVRVVEADPDAPSISVSADPITADPSEGVFLEAMLGSTDWEEVTVEILVDGKVVFTGIEPPYQTTWVPDEPGIFRIVVVANNGLGDRVESAPVRVTVSEHPLAWRKEASGVGAHLNDVVFAADRFLAVGQNSTVVESASAGVWLDRSGAPSASLNGIAEGPLANSSDDMVPFLVGVGEGGASRISSDGQSWTSLASQTKSRLTDVTYGNGIFVAVGDGGRIRTLAHRDGPWVARSSGVTDKLVGVTFADGKFVAVGQAGRILVSSNGKDWTSSVSGTSMPLHAVAYGSGHFVAVGGMNNQAVALTSPDGIVWSLHDPDIPRVLYGVAHGDGEFAAVGSGGVIARSGDGVGWTQEPTLSTTTLLAVGYGNDHFVAVGRDGVVWRDGAVMTMQNWLAQNFGDDLGDPEIGSSAADPGDFGISNLARYALGMDPHQPERENLPKAVVWSGDDPQNYPAVTFVRQVGADDISFVLEESEDLLTWETVSDAEIVSSTVQGDLETVIMRNSTPLGDDQKAGFLRLQIILAP